MLRETVFAGPVLVVAGLGGPPPMLSETVLDGPDGADGGTKEVPEDGWKAVA
jgi:hypothetical protein